MADLLIVDGYNIIGTWDELKVLQADDMGAAREQLISVLAAYRPWYWKRIIVVFDGKQGGFEEVAGVEVVYSGGGESADTVVERMVSSVAKICGVDVATSDREVRRAVRASGAMPFSAPGLKQRLLEMNEHLNKRDELPCSNRRSLFLDDVIQDEIRETLEKWRRKGPDGKNA